MPAATENQVLAASAVLRRAQKYLPQNGEPVSGTYGLVVHILIDEALGLLQAE